MWSGSPGSPIPTTPLDAAARSRYHGFQYDMDSLKETAVLVMNIKLPPLWGLTPIFRGPFLERVAYGQHRLAMLELRDYLSSFSPPSPDVPLRDWFDFFYSLLFEQYRCEYVYKNTIASELYLSERHPSGKSLLTNEFRIGKSRADVAILNGTSTVYEVKSEYDSFDRLDSQLDDYKKVFDYIFVVTTMEKALVAESRVGPPVGILSLEGDELKTVRDAQSNRANTDPGTIFDCMRQAEFCAAVEDRFGYVPEVPNSRLYRESRKLFCKLDPGDAHDLMVEKVRARKRQKPFWDLVEEAPTSLKHACLSFSKSQALAIRIRESLEKPLA